MQPRCAGSEFSAFSHGPHIVPQYRRAQRLVFGIEQNGTMHLTRKANGLYALKRVGIVLTQRR
jgi:hypothetical protein